MQVVQSNQDTGDSLVQGGELHFSRAETWLQLTKYDENSYDGVYPCSGMIRVVRCLPTSTVDAVVRQASRRHHR